MQLLFQRLHGIVPIIVVGAEVGFKRMDLDITCTRLGRIGWLDDNLTEWFVLIEGMSSLSKTVAGSATGRYSPFS